MQVLTRDEILSQVGGRRALRRALTRGDWQRVLHGVYVPGGVAVDLAVRAEAARRVLPVRSLVADRCLLWLLGVDVLPPGPPLLEVVVARGVVVPRRQGVRARSAALPRRDRCQLDGMPVLRPARAVVDLLRALPLEEAVVVADAVRHAGLADVAALQAELAAHAGLRGVRRAARALDLSDDRAESPPESRVRLVLVLAGLAPVPQLEVRLPAGAVARVDLGFPQARVAVEYDGRAVHLAGPVFVQERRRQNALVAAGWLVLRYTAADLRDRPQAVAAEVAAAVQQRTAA